MDTGQTCSFGVPYVKGCGQSDKYDGERGEDDSEDLHETIDMMTSWERHSAQYLSLNQFPLPDHILI